MRLFLSYPSSTQFSTLSLHDALPISWRWPADESRGVPSHPLWRGRRGRTRTAPPRRERAGRAVRVRPRRPRQDRKSTRLNSSHLGISYAVFCLKKKERAAVGTVSRIL